MSKLQMKQYIERNWRVSTATASSQTKPATTMNASNRCASSRPAPYISKFGAQPHKPIDTEWLETTSKKRHPIYFQMLCKCARRPTLSTNYAAGYDAYASWCTHTEDVSSLGWCKGCARMFSKDIQSNTSIELKAKKVTRVALGFRLEMMDAQVYARIETKSSAARHGLVVVGGIVDTDYTGEVIAMIYNTNDDDYYVDAKRQAIVQICFAPLLRSCVLWREYGMTQSQLLEADNVKLRGTRAGCIDALCDSKMCGNVEEYVRDVEGPCTSKTASDEKDDDVIEYKPEDEAVATGDDKIDLDMDAYINRLCDEYAAKPDETASF